MNNYCIYIRNRQGKPYCKLLNKEIPFSRCQECDKKEYRTKTRENSFYKSNNNQMKKKSTSKEKSPHRSGKMKSKSSKLAKLERNRSSVFTDNLEYCYLCGRKKEDLHEIFGGRNRLNSIKYNFVLPLCRECHSLNQNNPFFNDYWHKQGQEYWECNIGPREEFIRTFGRNYLD